MSDEQDDDAPDIPPALSAREWQRLQFQGPAFNVFVDGAVGLIVSDGAEPVEADSVKKIAALIALANEALRRFDDPRAVLRQHVALLRLAAKSLEWHGVADLMPEPEEEALYREADLLPSRLHEFADALESMLPPQEHNNAT